MHSIGQTKNIGKNRTRFSLLARCFLEAIDTSASSNRSLAMLMAAASTMVGDSDVPARSSLTSVSVRPSVTLRQRNLRKFISVVVSVESRCGRQLRVQRRTPA